MSLQDWERDVINRQRNIVFPDTLLNERRFYRNMISGRAVRMPVQVIGVLLVTAPYILTGCVGMASVIGSFLALQDPLDRLFALLPVFGALAPLCFGIIVAARGLLPAPAPVRKRRGGYRRSGRV